jgi:DNA ligase (NAD+)
MDRIQELAELIRYHSELYYSGKPELSDAEFDALIEEMKQLDPQNVVLLEVGAKLTKSEDGGFKKTKHASVMGSLDKSKSIPEIQAWYDANAQGKTIILTPKIDGCSLRLNYENGRLVQAATRGDGEEGQDVTANVNAIKSIPKHFGNTFSGEIRGEIYMRRSVWEKMGSGSNPRNCATGSLLQHDPEITASRNLDFYAYDVIMPVPNMFNTEEAKLNFLAGLMGIAVVPRFVFPCIDAPLRAALVEWENITRSRLDYDIDGMVLAVNDIDTQEAAGWSGKCPKGKLAFKFKPEQKVAEILKVQWFVGRTGRVTPVAVISPTRLAGTTVTNVTLHNYAAVLELGIDIGDKVLVEKAGDIIPQVVRVTEKTQATHPQEVVPADCPVCQIALVADKDKVNLWCQNPDCSAKLERRILHFLESINVMGIGPGIVEKMCRMGMVGELSDLYYLNQKELAGLLGGERMAEKVYKAIMEKNELDLAVFLDSLGIDGLGTTTSKLVAKHFKTLEAVRKATESEFLVLSGIASLTANKIVEGLVTMSPTIEKLLMCIDVRPVEDKTGPLTGKSFCITGALGKPRKDVEADIAAAGGDVKSSVGKGLTYLIQADASSTSAKSEKAKKLGTLVIDEATLYAMIG